MLNKLNTIQFSLLKSINEEKSVQNWKSLIVHHSEKTLIKAVLGELFLKTNRSFIFTSLLSEKQICSSASLQY